MKKEAKATVVTPLMNMERAFFEEQKGSLCEGYAARVQAVVDQWEAASEEVKGLRKKRFLKISSTTFFGAITIKVRQGINRKGRWVSPSLVFLGIRPNQRYSPDMEKRMAVLAVETGSYEKSSAVANAMWITSSDDAIHSLVMRLGRIAKDNPLSEMRPGAASREDTLIVMGDGWNARHRGKNWGRDKENRKLPERIHWHEIRSAVIFKLSSLLAVSGNRKAVMDKHVVAVPAETSPYAFGLLLQREMERMGHRLAKTIFFVMDGGIWLWNIFKDRFERCSKAMLDFYHLSQHLHELADLLYGSESGKAQAWCRRILHSLKHNSPKRLFSTLDELLSSPPSRSAKTLKAIRKENAYFRKHKEHMDYAANAALGIPIGSGSVESLCSRFQCRLKRTGQFWSKEGFAALLQITVRLWNNELESLWLTPAA